MNFDDELGLKRLNVIRKWSDEFNKYENHLAKVGSNINQIAHYLNKLADVGILSDKFLPELKHQYSVLIELLTLLNSSNMNFQKNASDFLLERNDELLNLTDEHKNYKMICGYEFCRHKDNTS